MTSKLYLEIARNAIESHFSPVFIDKDALIKKHPALGEPGAVFVTLTINNRLRGCIGSIIAHRSLLDDIIENAVSAAFKDPRFPSLQAEELDNIIIEVSLLTHPQPLVYSDAEELSRIIRPNIDGVIMRLGNHQATFLPQVWEELNDFDSFFTHLGLKAGIGSDPLALHPDIYIYQVEKIKEG